LEKRNQQKRLDAMSSQMEIFIEEKVLEMTEEDFIK
jgi:hypothetical protein